MSRFNFDNITLEDSADITKVMGNFNKIEEKWQTYEVPNGAIVGFEGDTIPGGYELVNNIDWVDCPTQNVKTNFGGVRYFRLGNIVVLQIYALNCATDLSTHNTVLATGMPAVDNATGGRNIFQVVRNASDTSNKSTLRLKVENDALRIHYSTMYAGQEYSGFFIYLTNE